MGDITELQNVVDRINKAACAVSAEKPDTGSYGRSHISAFSLLIIVSAALYCGKEL